MINDAEPDDYRAKAIAQWTAILETNLPGSEVGWQIIELIARPGELEKVKELLLDVFAKRATSTLDARATAVLLFIKWESTTGASGTPVLPIVEERLYV